MSAQHRTSEAHCDLSLTTEEVPPVKDWDIIADNLSKAVWSWEYVSAIDSNRRTIWIADAIATTESASCERMTAFLELESAIRVAANFS
jgi:hypothetical protein